LGPAQLAARSGFNTPPLSPATLAKCLRKCLASPAAATRSTGSGVFVTSGVGDSHEGPLNNQGKTRLKPAKNANADQLAHLTRMHNTTTIQVAPTARRDSTADAPRGVVRLARGPYAPRAGSASLEGSTTPLERGPPRSRAGHPLGQGPLRSKAPAHAFPASLERGPPRSRFPHERTYSRTRVRAFSALAQRSRATTRLGITPQRCSANSLGEPIPPLWGTVRRGRCQLRDTAPPTLVRLTRRDLEGGRPHHRALFS
jgi:hypothetical protein